MISPMRKVRNEVHRVPISARMRRRLRTNITAKGGTLELIQEIQNRIEGKELVLDDFLREEIEHLAWDLGRGRWQNLMRALSAEIDAVLGDPYPDPD